MYDSVIVLLCFPLPLRKREKKKESTKGVRLELILFAFNIINTFHFSSMKNIEISKFLGSIKTYKHTKSYLI